MKHRCGANGADTPPALSRLRPDTRTYQLAAGPLTDDHHAAAVGGTPGSLLPIRHVADLVGLHWHTVKAIDKHRLQRDLPAPNPTRLRRFMMDEIALHKGHRYATVVACADTQLVVWIGKSRSHEAIRPFFEWQGSARERIRAVVMDMNSAFDLE